MGDLDAKSTGSSATIKPWTQRMESFNPYAFTTGARVEFRKDQFAWGLGYELEVAENVTLHQAKLHVRYEF